jgi:hypothetical protein
MPYKPGQSGNPSGKPKGPFREILKGKLLDRLDEAFEQLAELKGEEWIRAYVSMLPYAYPKLQSISVGDDEGQGKGIKITIEDVSARSKDGKD